jgi:aminopeptidase N
VRCEPPLAPGEARTLQVRYHGELIDRVGDWMLLRSSTNWYPEPDGRHRAPFDLTFHAPSQYHLVSVGERVSSETHDRVTTTHWIAARPIHNASFVLGLFDEEPFGEAGAPPVTALMFRGRPDPIQVSFGDVQVVSGARMDRKVAADAARAVGFFHRVLGPPPAGRVTVAEIPDTGGEAFPGLIQITWTPFWGRNVAAEDAVFRAHEVAHQWWGYGVDYRTYHDHWLSEGFADFSALWYVQQGLGDTKSYLAVLEAWREEIFKDLRFRPSDSPPAGPIWLGYRSASIEAPGDHALIVYKKGAWVLHMLRNMLLDLATGNEERFAGLMRDFYARHEGHAATTEDFIRLAQRYAGEDLGWFFDQWVYGTDLPTYRFASRSERTPDNKVKVTCRVEQRGVPEGFRMPVPIRIEFGGDRFSWVRQVIQGARTEFELPLMEHEPQAIVFNDLQSVLCRVEQVKW